VKEFERYQKLLKSEKWKVKSEKWKNIP
jgi:hypothetical protein